MTRLLQIFILFSGVLVSLISSTTMAEPTKVTLLRKPFLQKTLSQEQIALYYPQQSVTLSYPQEVRLSQVLTDAYAQLDYQPYSLGTALIDLSKQQQIDEKKHAILKKLQDINTPASNYIAKKLNSLDFVYRERIETDPSKVRVNPKYDPMLKGVYQLFLPKRPQHIYLINADDHNYLTLKLTANSNLKDYLAEQFEANRYTYDSAWIIQANQDVYQATDIQWKGKLYFLSPGAIVFIGLTDLPEKYRDLNADIAHLLAFLLEP
ncbi:hypothetical protein B6N13_02010 [Marinomonas sp. UCMA 3892]|uniref:capsule biosynthesis GfcC D2 domain-containing protein n=1 Tax=Marinomonas sp. UCMA 3892 TaxID=1972585 RepID=UPI00146E7962|nr:capsule biosynthesis GfcC D2 domain-containing protein [Marinomonas sp. UCMA 3892]NLU96873.1 hypothetical protein [Marinomonas sp. UCMA 3892]